MFIVEPCESVSNDDVKTMTKTHSKRGTLEFTE